MSKALFQLLNDINTQNIEQQMFLFEQLPKTLSQLHQAVDKLECKILEKDFIHLQDMFFYIHTNPYLKNKEAKEATFNRYLEIYKQNHAENLNKPIYCHYDDKDHSTTLIQALDEFLNHH